MKNIGCMVSLILSIVLQSVIALADSEGFVSYETYSSESGKAVFQIKMHPTKLDMFQIFYVDKGNKLQPVKFNSNDSFIRTSLQQILEQEMETSLDPSSSEDPFAALDRKVNARPEV
ncbi:MAG: hypothetical protein AAB116_01310, partial [Candidatus Poribacteria bacterium]